MTDLQQQGSKITSGATETTVYLAGLLEKVTKGTPTEYRHRIEATPGTSPDARPMCLAIATWMAAGCLIS